MNIGYVVQFNENHKWCGCLGIIEEIKICKVPSENEDVIKTDTRYMVGVPMPMQGTAYIFVMESENAIEYVGTALLVPRKEEENDTN